MYMYIFYTTPHHFNTILLVNRIIYISITVIGKFKYLASRHFLDNSVSITNFLFVYLNVLQMNAVEFVSNYDFTSHVLTFFRRIER